MKIDIWDLDGTLTYAYGDIIDKTGLTTYAFWPLITEQFTQDVDALRQITAEWEESMKTEPDPTGSSHSMLQRGIDTFPENITQQHIYLFAKEITKKFIQHQVIRREAIAHLEERIKQGVLCIISTGSYQDGAFGFVDALIENHLLSITAKNSLLISGAVIDWEKRLVLHANVRDRKLIGIEMVTGKKIGILLPHIEAVYADDPWINDRDILSIVPQERAYVIKTIKNQDKELPLGLRFTSWEEVISRKK